MINSSNTAVNIQNLKNLQNSGQSAAYTAGVQSPFRGSSPTFSAQPTTDEVNLSSKGELAEPEKKTNWWLIGGLAVAAVAGAVVAHKAGWFDNLFSKADAAAKAAKSVTDDSAKVAEKTFKLTENGKSSEAVSDLKSLLTFDNGVAQKGGKPFTGTVEIEAVEKGVPTKRLLKYDNGKIVYSEMNGDGIASFKKTYTRNDKELKIVTDYYHLDMGNLGSGYKPGLLTCPKGVKETTITETGRKTVNRLDDIGTVFELHSSAVKDSSGNWTVTEERIRQLDKSPDSVMDTVRRESKNRRKIDENRSFIPSETINEGAALKEASLPALKYDKGIVTRGETTVGTYTEQAFGSDKQLRFEKYDGVGTGFSDKVKIFDKSGNELFSRDRFLESHVKYNLKSDGTLEILKGEEIGIFNPNDRDVVDKIKGFFASKPNGRDRFGGL